MNKVVSDFGFLTESKSFNIKSDLYKWSKDLAIKYLVDFSEVNVYSELVF